MLYLYCEVSNFYLYYQTLCVIPVKHYNSFFRWRKRNVKDLSIITSHKNKVIFWTPDFN